MLFLLYGEIYKSNFLFACFEWYRKQQIGRPGSYFTNIIHHLTAQKRAVPCFRKITTISAFNPPRPTPLYSKYMGFITNKSQYLQRVSLFLVIFCAKDEWRFWITHTASAAWENARHRVAEWNLLKIHANDWFIYYRVVCSINTGGVVNFIVLSLCEIGGACTSGW